MTQSTFLQKYKLSISFIGWAIITLFVIYLNKKHYCLLKDFTNPTFLIMFIIMIGYSIYSYKSNDPKLKRSSEAALTAFIIAYLARLDLVFAAYVLVYMFTYYAVV